MLSGVALLWFILTGFSVAFVAIDIRRTPESSVMKWGFVIVTAFTGPIGAFLYILGCREPLPDSPEQFVAVRWRQVLGSTMHCVAGDGLGILAAARLHAFCTCLPGGRSRPSMWSGSSSDGPSSRDSSCRGWPEAPTPQPCGIRWCPNSLRVRSCSGGLEDKEGFAWHGFADAFG